MMLTVMAGSDPADPDSTDADANKTDYVKGLTADALKGKRVGVIRGFGGYSEQTKPAFDQMLEVLKAQGAELVDIPLDIFEDLAPEQRLIMYWDIKDDIAAYLANAPAAVKVRTLADIIAFNKTEEHEKQHGQQHFEQAQALDGKQSADHQKLRDYARKRAGEDGYGRALKEYNVSALVMLTRGPAAEIPPDGTERSGPALDRPKGEQVPSGSGQAALAGYPDLSVPGGMVDGMPVGLSFIGSKWSEATLLSYAYAFEQAAHARVPPKAYKDAVVAKN